MRNFIHRLLEKYMHFMMGRNGFDAFGQGLFVMGITMNLLGLLFRTQFFLLLSNVIFIYELFRMFSKNTVKRSIENQSYIVLSNWGRHLWKAFVSNLKDKDHKYFVCPQCHQIVRVPRGRGKIEITCPTCHKEFTENS